MSKRIRIAVFIACLVALAGVLAAFAGRLLIVNNAQRSDVMVVLAGDTGDFRLQHAVELLEHGYAKELVIDEGGYIKYGQPMYEYAQAYANKLPEAIRPHVHVCEYQGDATQLELRSIAPCLRAVLPSASSGLVVTSDYHTRRALSVARRVLPGYKWTVAATPEAGQFGVRWWEHREWAKTCLMEWQKLIWWQLAGRWRA